MENLEAEPKIGTTNRLQEQMKSVLLKESLQIRLRKEIEEYLNANYVPFRLVKEIHDVISDSGDQIVLTRRRNGVMGHQENRN